MIKAEAVDQTTVINILRRVFEDTQNVKFILGIGKKRIHKTHPLMNYSYEEYWMLADVCLFDDKNACALLLHPEKKCATLRSIWLDTRLIVQTNGYQGVGSRLLEVIISSSKYKKIPIYLETTTLINLRGYNVFGFKRYNQLKFGYTLFFLKRGPDK